MPPHLHDVYRVRAVTNLHSAHFLAFICIPPGSTLIFSAVLPTCDSVSVAWSWVGWSTDDVVCEMTSKFFTWTKGDRRNATEALQSGGVVPIPVECLKIKGMDYARSSNVRDRLHQAILQLRLIVSQIGQAQQKAITFTARRSSLCDTDTQ